MPQQIIIQGNTNNNQQLELDYKTSGNYGSIPSVQQNVGFDRCPELDANHITKRSRPRSERNAGDLPHE